MVERLIDYREKKAIFVCNHNRNKMNKQTIRKYTTNSDPLRQKHLLQIHTFNRFFGEDSIH